MGEKWLVTGANGNLGRRLVTLCCEQGDEVVAVVRSERAAQTLRGLELGNAASRLSIETLEYGDVDRLRAAAAGCSAAVHLVGILKEGGGATYEQAHERSCEALARALEGGDVQQLVYLSIVGSKPDAGNACLASKGRAEDILLNGEIPTSVLRVPMVLGEGDYASFALKSRASKRLSFTFRAGSLEQPIYAGDVAAAVTAAGRGRVGNLALDLGGPEVLSRRALSERAAARMGRSPGVLCSLPLPLGLIMAGLLERVLANPPVTRAMLEVLDHDDHVDAEAALDRLGTSLTPLDETLDAVLAPKA